MADKKISQLTNLTGASLAEDDEFVLVDTSADETKAITWSELKEGLDTGTGFVRITGDTMTGDLTVPNVVVSGNVGIGTGSPSGALDVIRDSDDAVINVRGLGNTIIRARQVDDTGFGYFSFGDSSDIFVGGMVYDHNNDSMQFNVNNAERMRINSSGNVGIGTSNPVQLLHLSKSGIAGVRIEDTDAAGGYVDLEVNGSAFFIDSHDEDGTEGLVVFRTAGTETMRINSSGNVGIGTSNPSQALEVNGSIRASGTGAAAIYIEDGASSSTDNRLIALFNDNGLRMQTRNSAGGFVSNDFMVETNASGAETFRFNVANSEVMRINSSGNVGIGTTSPEAILHVADGGSSNNNFTAMISAFRPNLTFQDRSAGTTNDWEIFVDSDDMAFLYGDATTGTKLANEAMRIKDSGNVGIGTASPQEKLHVIGSAKLDFGSAVGNPRLYFDHDTVTDDANYIQLNRGDAGLEIISEDNLKFDTNGSERMRIDSLGRVTMPYQPAFAAYAPAKTTTGANVIYGATRSNIGNHYNTTTGRFTAPIAGTYFFSFSALMGQPYTGSNVRLYFDVNGVRNATYGDSLMDKGGQVAYSSINMSISLYLNANEYVSVWNAGVIPTYDTAYGQFSGHLIG